MLVCAVFSKSVTSYISLVAKKHKMSELILHQLMFGQSFSSVSSTDRLLQPAKGYRTFKEKPCAAQLEGIWRQIVSIY